MMVMVVKRSQEHRARHGSKTSRQEAGSRLIYSITEVGPEHDEALAGVGSSLGDMTVLSEEYCSADVRTRPWLTGRYGLDLEARWM